jgi:hypothetical protein
VNEWMGTWTDALFALKSASVTEGNLRLSYYAST